ncbi:MAG: hydroxymethylglutaryl-CoA lyase, partial [Albidovulum sp.]
PPAAHLAAGGYETGLDAARIGAAAAMARAMRGA